MSEHNQRFDTYQQWVNNASSWLTRHPDYRAGRFHAICYDTMGRLCQCGGDMMRARDEGAFPVRWVWPDQVAEKMAADAMWTGEAAEAVEREAYSGQHQGALGSIGTGGGD
jgi:hypothetical protein